MAGAGATPRNDGPRTSSTRIIVGVVSLTLLAAILIMAAFAASYVVRGKPLPVHDEDRVALAKAADLEPYFESLLIRTDAEAWSKFERLSGAIVLEYRYRHPEEARPLVVISRIVVCEDLPDSEAEFTRQVADLVALVPHGDGVVRRRRDDLLRLGDDSACLVSSNDSGENVAIGFVARNGRRIFAFHASGAPMNAQRILMEVVESYGGRLAEYQPL